MSIQFRCDQCSHTLAIGTHKAGSTIHCPVCLAMVTVPPDAADAPSADDAWWQDAAQAARLPAPTPSAAGESWLTRPAPAPAAPVAFTAPRPSASPPPARKACEPPPARKPAAVTTPSNRVPAIAALGGGFALLLLAGTLTVLALPREHTQEQPPPVVGGGHEVAGQLARNEPRQPAETISVPAKPPEITPPERVGPPVVAPAPEKPAEKQKPAPAPTPPAEKEKTPPPVERPAEVGPRVVEPAPAGVAEKIVVKRRSDRSEDDLVKRLETVPTIKFDRTAARAESTAAIQAARLAFLKGKTHSDTTLAMLDRRPDLAGLPLRRGDECRLTPSATNHLDSGSLALRTALASTAADPSRLSTTLTGDKAQFNKWQKPEAVPALMQMLMAEAQTVREVLVDQLTRIEGKTATQALAQLAVFDLNPRVREQAIVALEKRPVKEYRDILLKGFDHPWPAVADNAAEAVVALKLPDAVPALLSQLDKPDPQAPYEKPGSTTRYVKEMVRVNHFLNCLMCHPASTSTTDKVRGLVPTLDKPIPSGVAYYSAPQGQFVRADITYLKQDFSTVLPVEKPGLWPRQQRFDFVVRERVARPADLEAGVARKAAGPTPHQKATFFALRELTGRDPGPSVEDWKKLALGRKLEVSLRYRGLDRLSVPGLGGARGLAVDERGRAYIAAGMHILRQEGDAAPAVWLDGGDPTTWRGRSWSGLAFDRKGHLVAGRSGPADVVRIDTDTRAITPLAALRADKPVEGPRRLVVDNNGGIFCGEEPSEGKSAGLFYVSAHGSITKAVAGIGRVRGLDLSPDGKTLYAALGTGPEVRAFAVESAGAVGKGRLLGRLAPHDRKTAGASGLAVDSRGLIYVISPQARQIEVFGPEGASLARTRLDEPPVACALGGEGRRTLYVLTPTSLYTMKLSDDAKLTASR